MVCEIEKLKRKISDIIDDIQMKELVYITGDDCIGINPMTLPLYNELSEKNEKLRKLLNK